MELPPPLSSLRQACCCYLTFAAGLFNRSIRIFVYFFPCFDVLQIVFVMIELDLSFTAAYC